MSDFRPPALPGAESHSVWRLLDDLTLVRERMGLRPATLTVLRALCSFLPQETRDGGFGGTVVWPSNETLAERASGMPERSLRRHLGHLVEAGLLLRKSSANGKRFALRVRGQVATAFGFDLAPLLQRREDIAQAVEAAQAEDEALRLLRCEIRALIAGHPETDHLTRLLRRKLTREELRNIHRQLSVACKEMAANNSQNGRHLQKTDKESRSVFPDSLQEEPRLPRQSACEESVRTPENDCSQVGLADCIDALSESFAFAEKPVESWQDLTRLADRMAPMVGIASDIHNRSSQVMGRIPAAVTVLCLVQIHDRLRSPGAYLNGLVERSSRGCFSLAGLLRMATRKSHVRLQV